MLTAPELKEGISLIPVFFSFYIQYKSFIPLFTFSQTQAYRNLSKPLGQSYYIRTYAILCGGSVTIVFVRGFLSFYLFCAASRTLHNKMFDSIIRAPMQFFDTNPVGKLELLIILGPMLVQ